MYILGISAFYHDSAACLVKDGEIVAAAQEERFSRIKHDHAFPSNTIQFYLKEVIPIHSLQRSDYENPHQSTQNLPYQL